MRSNNQRRLPTMITGLLLFLTLFGDTAAAQVPGRFVPTGNMTMSRQGHTATLLLNGKVLITGGGAPTSAELYDPETGTFTPTGNMTTPRGRNAATVLSDGRVLVVGNGTADLYDPATGTFTLAGVIPMGQVSAATLMDNGKVLITAARAQLYDPATGTIVPAGEYAQSLQYSYAGSANWFAPTLSLPNGKILIAGEPSTELYDPATGKFGLAGTMAAPLSGQPFPYIEGRSGTLLANGKVLLAGGSTKMLVTSQRPNFMTLLPERLPLSPT